MKFSAVCVLGLLAPLWWTWAVSQISYGIYLASGSPARPARALVWASVYAPSFVLGFAAGLLAVILSPASPLKAWVAFFGSLVIGALMLGAFYGAPTAYLQSLFGAPGNWFFFAGSILWPAVAYVRKRAA